MPAITYTNADLGKPKRITLSATPGNVRLVNCPINARNWTITTGTNYAQWKNGEGVSDNTAIGSDYDTVIASSKVAFPLPGTRGGVTRNLNTPKLAIAGEAGGQIVEIVFY